MKLFTGFGGVAFAAALMGLPAVTMANTIVTSSSFILESPVAPSNGAADSLDVFGNEDNDVSFSIFVLDGIESGFASGIIKEFSEIQFLTSGSSSYALDVTGQDQVDKQLADELNGVWTYTADLYDGTAGPLGENATMIMGFRYSEITPVFDDCQNEVVCEVFTVSAFAVEEVSPFTYGWLALERGSISVNTIGYNPTGAGAVLPVSAVPLPAGLPMLLAGVGLFGWMRRRNG